MNRPATVDGSGNGTRTRGTFTDAEYARRHAAIRAAMNTLDVDATLFTSYQNIAYHGDFPYCRFGRRYGLVIDAGRVTSVAAGIDGGQPWRRTRGSSVTYTDWGRDHCFRALKPLLGDAKRVGIELDHVDLETRALLEEHFPRVELVDVAPATTRLRLIESGEEIDHIAQMARIADLGGAAVVEAVRVGVPEHEVALASTAAMVREIART